MNRIVVWIAGLLVVIAVVAHQARAAPSDGKLKVSGCVLMVCKAQT